MRSITLFFLLVFFSNLNGQNDFFDTFLEFNRKQDIDKNIKSIIEYEYTNISLDQDAIPDTIFTYNGDEVKLYLTSKATTNYENPVKQIENRYNKEGELKLTSTVTLDDEGRTLFWEMDMGDGPAAALMNSTKHYKYDEKGRILSVTENGQEIINLGYTKDGYIDQLLMDAGFGKMKITSKDTENKIRYDMEVDVSSVEEGFAALFAEQLKDSPKEFIEMEHGKETDTYTGFKENKESGKFAKKWTAVRDKSFLMISKIQYGNNGEIISHNEFKYNKNGDLQETKNMIDSTSLVNEYDEAGNLIIEDGEYINSYHSYDDMGNLVKTITLVGNDENAFINSLIIRHIEYK